MNVRLAFALLRYRAAAERSGVSVAGLSDAQLLVGVARLAAAGSVDWHSVDRAAMRRVGPAWSYIVEVAVLGDATARSSAGNRSHLAQQLGVWLLSRFTAS